LEACLEKGRLQYSSQEHDAWDVVNWEDWMNVLTSMWAFKCTCFSNG
jgi:hypothetical protein